MNQAELLKLINDHFNEEDLKTLCFNLSPQVDYDSLPAQGKAGKARELISLLKRQGRKNELIQHLTLLRPNVTWKKPSKLFISYKQHAEQDNNLALFLHDYLGEQDHDVFIDRTLRTGMSWLDEIDEQIKNADYLIVLLSEESANSEMVKAEVNRAYEYKQLQGFPEILPVRLNYQGMLPYSIAAFTNPKQYVLWNNASDNEQVGNEILSAIENQLPLKNPIHFTTSKSERISPPEPVFDPRRLSAPGGAIMPNDELYIEREADNELNEEITKQGSTTIIRAPRQMGKTSLLIKSLAYAEAHNFEVVSIDIQGLGKEQLNSLDIFLRCLAEMICSELDVDYSSIEKIWNRQLPPSQKLTYFLEKEILSSSKNSIIIAIDEADGLLLSTDFYTDFYGLLRYWHNRRARKPEIWTKLNLALVISTEPYLLIDDAAQSPFNVGATIELYDFNIEQVSLLNKRHNSPLNESDLPKVMNLLGGHPFLHRRLFYLLARGKNSWTDIVTTAALDEGPFADHLRHHYWMLNDNHDLLSVLREVIKTGRSKNEDSIQRLVRAGLIQKSDNIYICRCDLYRQYFVKNEQ